MQPNKSESAVLIATIVFTIVGWSFLIANLGPKLLAPTII